MKRSFVIGLGLCGLLWLTGAACVGTAPTREVRHIDSLNRVAYASRYRNLDVSQQAAQQAFDGVKLYASGKAEASNHLGFCAFMRMDFEEAIRCHRAVYDLTQNELELLIADVGLMKVYQRTALYKEFYDYRNRALRRMKRIEEDTHLFANPHERKRLNYARSEFHIVSAVYYYYLQQRLEAMANIERVTQTEALTADTSQWLYYHYIIGSAALCTADTPDDQRLQEFDELYATWRTASRSRYAYFEGNGLQGLANLMVTPESYAFFLDRRRHLLQEFGQPVDSLLPMRLGQMALQKFRAYDDLYQIAGAYVSIGKYLNYHGRYAEALDTLQQALECVNLHHRRYYHCNDSTDWLQTYDRRHLFSVERAWLEHRLMTVPEWISRIREQLSVAYAGLGMKRQSDYNRNVYLDILEDTRQDKELESRFQALEAESGKLNFLLALVLVGAVCLWVFFYFFNRWSKARNALHLQRLQLLLDVCRKLTASVPADAQTEEEVNEAMSAAVAPEMEQLFGIKNWNAADGLPVLPASGARDERAMLQVIAPYIRWTLDNGVTSISLADERRRLEKQRYIYEQHIADNKRQNLMKKACVAIVNGIHPYIDRIVNEVYKLTRNGYMEVADIKYEKYRYIDELVTTINEYNDILALWIKMKQGTLSLHVETFDLNELFDLLRKGSHAFELKQQQFEVVPTDCRVKADKALTLFMINTLAENARKYTQPGGRVQIDARRVDDYVEISVTDNGRGLSAEDVALLRGEKVYDSQRIGCNDADNREELKANKGSGFGLMNCKGIIEKYRKTNDLFKVCVFDVESTYGRGSRFFFRLPVGVRQALGVGVCLVLLTLTGCGRAAATADGLEEAIPEDSLTVDSGISAGEDAYMEWLDVASDFANEAYYSNIDGHYRQSLQYIDSAICYLNRHYRTYAERPQHFMVLTGEGEGAEMDWWENLFHTDYHVILDLRNEAAVAFLALKEWDHYAYNNAAYTTLYKLLGEDQSLEEYCRRLERSTNNKIVGMLLAGLLVAVLLLGFYLLYFRKRLVNRWNLEQMLEINSRVYQASQLQPSGSDSEEAANEEEMLNRIPQQLVREAFDAVNELLNINSWCIGIYNEQSQRLDLTAYPVEAEAGVEWSTLMNRCFETQLPCNEGGLQAWPLVADVAGTSRCIGVMGLARTTVEQEGDRLLMQLLASYVAIVVFNAVVKLANQYRDIEEAQDEARRASHEESVLHVQNLVLDNCLSTIKHETIYYPHKIKQLIGKLRTAALSAEEERDTVATIGELIAYYKGMFTLLSQCASRQLEAVTFRRSRVSVDALVLYAQKYAAKATKAAKVSVMWKMEFVDACVVGDEIQLRCLLENLIDEALSVPQSGEIELRASVQGDFVRFDFTDRRRTLEREALNQLFYPSLARMSAGARGQLHGVEYLMCKQIIREHDEYAGRRGCRINAEPAAGGGFTVYFTAVRCR